MAYAMSEERLVKIFRNGRNRAVRIPKEFDFLGDDAVMRKEGNTLVIEPVNNISSLKEWLATLEPTDEAWPQIDDPPPEPVDL